MILNSSIKDIPEIFKLYASATELQRQKFPQNQWPKFDKALIETEVSENRQFKLLLDGKIACIWAITYNDPQIWENTEKDSALYIHRIATNPKLRGKNFVKVIVDWAMDFSRIHDKQFIRMDTCGKNERLIDHYTSNGFEFLGIKNLKNTSDLPSHYHNADVCFFEIKLF